MSVPKTARTQPPATSAPCAEISPSQDLPGLEDPRELRVVAGRGADARQRPVAVADLELLRVAALEQPQPERSVGRCARGQLERGRRAILDADASPPAPLVDHQRVDGEDELLAPGARTSRASRGSPVCGPAGTLGATSSLSPVSSRAFDASTKPAKVAPRATRTMIVVRFTPPPCSHTGSRRSGQSSDAGRLARALDLYEYQGKELFRRYGIPVSEGRLATTPAEAREAGRGVRRRRWS